jgi:hypothetical protein
MGLCVPGHLVVDAIKMDFVDLGRIVSAFFASPGLGSGFPGTFS